MTTLFEQRRDMLDGALSAMAARGYWTPFSEMPSGKIYGEAAQAEGEAAYQARLNAAFNLPGHPEQGRAGAEVSPYGPELNITYPAAGPDALIDAAQQAGEAWGAASVETRTGICLEFLKRLNAESFQMANAVNHTTGQAFMMAFQAGGAHAQDRGLEAVAAAYAEMTRLPARARWEKPAGKGAVIAMEKRWRTIPRGVALVIGCATFPTWNGYPGLFASLVTGNPVIVKPHPAAILPLAITLEIGRNLLEEQGFDPNLLLLAAENPGGTIAADLATRPEVKIIDFTGSTAFGSWLRANAAQAQVYTEEAGVNSIAITGTSDFRGMCGNIAFSLSLYSGQMCTAPQALFVPRDGIETEDGRKTLDELAQGIKIAMDKLLGDPARAAGVLGALVSDDVKNRVAASRSLGEVVRDSAPLDGPARTATPLILKVDADASDAWREELFGPISFIIGVKDGEDAIRRAAGIAAEKGAITGAVYATDDALLELAEQEFGAAGVNLSCNLLGGIFVNQSAAFSDPHATGANPAANCSLTDAAFVANRFRHVMVRRLAG